MTSRTRDNTAYPPLPESRMGDDEDQRTTVPIPMSPTARSMVRSSKAQSISPSESPSQQRGLPSRKNPSIMSNGNGAEFSPRSGSRQGINGGASEFTRYNWGYFFVTIILHVPHLFVYRDLILILMASVSLSHSYPLFLQVVHNYTRKALDLSCPQVTRAAHSRHTGTRRPRRTCCTPQHGAVVWRFQRKTSTNRPLCRRHPARYRPMSVKAHRSRTLRR